MNDVEIFKGLSLDMVTFDPETSHGLTDKKILGKLFARNIFESIELDQAISF